MKTGTVALIAVAMLVFFGLVVYSTMSAAEHTCDVCLEFAGERVCRSGAGATVEEAQRAAQESVCGGNTSGMAEAITCRNQRPVSVQCATR
jgi:hypothetical protein